ncbi:DUF6090 family protein [Congregibacter sp.]|uniref:DUF6090 family protein n=1 Tax=Congregibacter sp. TaxID=2744308 RepID=UPI00385F26D2
MIIQRIAQALRSQDWVTVTVEFFLVVLGVLVALEVDRYNERQKERAEELAFLAALQRDLQTDIVEYQLILDGFQAVEEFGLRGVGTLEADGCEETTCWRRLLELFHASQWLNASVRRETYEEMKLAGLPTSSALKAEIDRYYDIVGQQSVLTTELPAYREFVRSMIPPKVQQYIWTECFSVDGRFESYSVNCASPISESRARSIIEQLQGEEQVKRALTFWISNLTLVKITLPQRNEAANEALDAVANELADENFHHVREQ